jgi:hypothetical protein
MRERAAVRVERAIRVSASVQCRAAKASSPGVAVDQIV